MTDKLERITTIRAAYDCIRVQPCIFGSDTCTPGSGGSHGIHNAEMHMTVRGPDAEVTLVLGTGWDLPSVPQRRQSSVRPNPWGMYVEFHTAWPQYEDHEPYSKGRRGPGDVCADWDDCYTNTGYSMADKPAALLVEKGSDAVWEWLEAEHQRMLDEKEACSKLNT